MEKKNQHYVPQFYLKYFTDYNVPAIYKPYVWIYDRTKKSFYNKNPKHVASENGYNNIIDKNGNVTSIVEDQFQQIEDSASKVFRDRITKLKFISRNERLILAKFVFSMMGRVPQFSTMYEQAVKNGYFNKYNRIIKPEDISLKLMMDSIIRTTDKASRILLNMDWSLLIAPKENDFITSDNPVIVQDTKLNQLMCGGFGNIDAVIKFPLTNKICLFGSWGRYRRVVESISKDAVKQINFLTALNSYRYVFSNSQDLLKEIVGSTEAFYK